jgi:integrase
VLTVMLDDIIAEEWCPHLQVNPARLPKVREVLPPRVTRAAKNTVVYLEQSQVETLLRCRFVPPRRRVRYLIGFLSGLRDGEVSGLLVSDVLDHPGVLDITKAFALVSDDGKKGLQDPKSENSKRLMPIHPVAQEALGWWIENGWPQWVGRKARPTDYLFPTDNGLPARPRSAYLLRRDLGLAGLPTQYKGNNIVFHSLRASFCTGLEEEDASEPIKSKLMGQGPRNVADDHYTSKSFKRLQAAVESLKINVTLADLTTYEQPPRKPQKAFTKEGDSAPEFGAKFGAGAEGCPKLDR